MQQRLAIFVPLIALGLSLFVVYPAWRHFGKLGQDIEGQRRELRALKEAPVITRSSVAPAADDLPAESPEFLRQIREMAEEANCHLTVDLSPPDQTPDTGPIRAVRAKIELDTQYVRVRDFLYRLNHAPRLYVVTDLTLATTTATNSSQPSIGVLHATIEIERYVISPAAKATAPSA
jgi:hypothetical protein